MLSFPTGLGARTPVNQSALNLLVSKCFADGGESSDPNVAWRADCTAQLHVQKV